MERKLIRKLINNIYDMSRNIDIMMELEDRRNSDSAIAISASELSEVRILLSQADYLKEYLEESKTMDERTGNGKWILHEWAEEENGCLIDNYECSQCGSWFRNNTKFCPSCGARQI